jgi:hypothetical protein
VAAGVMALKSGDRFGDLAIISIRLRAVHRALASSPIWERDGLVSLRNRPQDAREPRQKQRNDTTGRLGENVSMNRLRG